MEHESFEDPEIAALMNERFVNIKVDREERPDLDQIYMAAVQAFQDGHGGWPMSVFLTPDLKPFYGGTYYPPTDSRGMPGFPRVLRELDRAWRERRDDVDRIAGGMTERLQASGLAAPSRGELTAEPLDQSARELARAFDPVHGGFVPAPKFPHPMDLRVLLRQAERTGDSQDRRAALHTLDKMARGGIYDQVGGGFHRYSVEDRWLVPHFEKMLYDNALLARLYLDAARALSEPEFLTVAREICDYVLREMTSPEGGFYSTQDADSEGEEGKFFLWTPAEVEEVLGDARLAKIAEQYFDITSEGNFEGSNILHRTMEIADAARVFGMSADDVAAAIDEIKQKLFAAREKRVKPGRDEKVLAAWNGMMISALAEAYRALHEPRYLAAASKAAEFVMTTLWDGRSLRRSFKDGTARFNAYLEDYALAGSAMLDLYQATFSPQYLEHARTMADAILERFLDRDRGGFFFTSDDHEQLITRFKAAFDGSTPSGNSAAVMLLLRLHAYTGDDRYFREAERAIQLFREFMEKQPFAFSHLLEAVDLYLRGPTEIVVVGDRGSSESREWMDRIGLLYVPNLALYAVDPNAPGERFVPELARGKDQVDGHLTAYVCRERVCSTPLTSFKEIEAEVRG
jgi:uncharacterized protein YyaL (SSP411 family)